MKKIIAGVVACMCLMITACSSLKDDSLKEDRVLESDRTSEADNGDKVLDGNKSGTEQESQVGTKEMYTRKTKIADVINDKVFGDYGRLIFPVESGYYNGDTLEDLNLTWYNNIDPDTTVEIVNYMKSSVMQGETIFYDIYSDEEKAKDPAKEDTGLFFFKGNKGEKFAVCNAGGAFAYVGAMQDSLQNYTATTMLANSEFVVLLKQANTDSSKMAEVIGVSEAQLRFVTNTASGMGLIKCGSVVIPFDNQISKDTDLYKLYNTNIHEKIAEAKKRENQRKISVD